jgi:hypothetical protein
MIAPMKTVTVVLIAVLAGACLGGYAGFRYAQSKGPTVSKDNHPNVGESSGRFQLIPGEYVWEGMDKEGHVTQTKEHGVFRIDTQTGDTSLFTYTSGPEGLRMYWAPMTQ